MLIVPDSQASQPGKKAEVWDFRGQLFLLNLTLEIVGKGSPPNQYRTETARDSLEEIWITPVTRKALPRRGCPSIPL
jgi:hypothetical protein